MIVSQGKTRRPRTATKVTKARPPAPKGIRVGTTVQALDKGNYGTVVAIAGKPRVFTVRFVNPATGDEAEVDFGGAQIRPAHEPKHPERVAKERREAADKAQRQAAYKARKRAELLDDDEAPAGRDLENLRKTHDPNGVCAVWNISSILTPDESTEWLARDGFSVTKVSSLNPHVRVTKGKASKVKPFPVTTKRAGSGATNRPGYTDAVEYEAARVARREALR